MPMSKIGEAAQWLADRDRFVILTHRRPDGDTIGSAAFLCRGLQQMGKTAHVLYNPEVTEKYKALLEGLTVTDVPENAALVAVDVAAIQMLPDSFQHLADRIGLRIDHHASSTSFAETELVDGGYASCGELVYDVLMARFVDLDVPMANALYTAVSTDTGCFRYANTTSHSFAVAAACAWVSPDIFKINQNLFDTNSLGRLRLQGWLVENAEFLNNGKAVICALPRAVEQQLGLTEDDMENVSGFPRSIEGVRIAATLREEPDGKIKVSVRAVPGYDAAEICAVFGGGGHKGAAGATLNMTMEQAVEAIKAAMPVME